MVERLLVDLLDCPEIGQIIVTRNIPELLTIPQDDRILLQDNVKPAGFAANHNAAFRLCHLPFFCPLNPDIQLSGNPFPPLLAALEDTEAAIVAPLVLNPSGEVEDSLRSFPTLYSLLLKVVKVSDGRCAIKEGLKVVYPEWVAGMFMLFRSSNFRQLDGFDPKFFLYYEDVDICVRAWKAGMKVLACSSVTVIHDAQRASHGNLRFLRWHISSMVRYFYKHWGRLPILPSCE